ncbi:hypothetical protein AGMMS49965_05610 [Bacteroidia bacterium]|nr:hypothetical protein AGMMS49965_05610 [Bacteroidia bacterium]
MKTIQVKHVAALSLGITDWKSKAELMMQVANRAAVSTVNWAEAFPYCPDVEFYTAWADNTFYLLFDVQEDTVKAVSTGYQSPVWEDSCVEFFIQTPDPEEDTYRNFEFNCIGGVLASVRRNRKDFRSFTDAEMNKLVIHTSLPKQPITTPRACRWQLLAEIPFEMLGMPNKSPIGRKLRANFYKCGDKTPTPHYLTWNPVGTPDPDFHRPEFFGAMEMVD